MKLGVCLPQLGPAATTAGIRSFALTAEAAGIHALWVEEHLFRPVAPITGFGGVDGAPWPEKHSLSLAPLEVLAFVAGLTERCRLGTSILVTGYHDPLVLAKETATVDLLAEGRLTLGLGAGWCEDEYQLLGRSFRDRGRYSDETLEALRVCWGANPVEYSGEFVTIPACETSPKPATGHLPIHGGFMTKAGRRRVARWCDGWQPFGLEAAPAVDAMAALNQLAWDEFGRPPLELALRVLIAPGAAPEVAGPMRRSTGVWGGSYSDLARRLADARERRVDEVIMDANFAPGSDDPGFWAELADQLPSLIDAARA
jgi:probable F420-dependent oxidoreductase